MQEAWITLSQIEHIGPRTILGLLEHYPDPRAILNEPIKNIEKLGILNSRQLKSLANHNREMGAQTIEQTKGCGARVISLHDSEYPASLKEIHDPPPVIYIKGSLADIEPSVAIVGTRSPSHSGQQQSHAIAQRLSLNGISIISGLARGIDSAAHNGCLSGPSPTVAVLGSGIDKIYPAENSKLATSITQQGAVISEYPPGIRPDPQNFPRRNRIIAGLSLATVVIEATIRSGAMITARLAAESGRQIMALPGSVTNIRTKGPHKLIRDGATLIENAEDILMEIAPHLKDVLNRQSRADSELGTIFGGEALTMEQIADIRGRSINEIADWLSQLELTGSIERIPGGRYIVRSDNV